MDAATRETHTVNLTTAVGDDTIHWLNQLNNCLL
jgi:hypothetical protein